MPVALWREADASPEPLLLSKTEYLVEGVSAGLTAIGEIHLRRCHIARMDLLDEAVHHGTSEGVLVDDLTLQRALVSSERGGRKAHDLRVRQAPKDLLPALRRCMVTPVDEDHVEEVGRELRQPAVS